MTAVPKLYDQYFAQKGDERRGLFQGLQEKFGFSRGLYPGSFVHITPSFYIPEMVYADTDKRCPKFFSNHEVLRYIGENTYYPEDPVYRFHQVDFTQEIEEPEGFFDVLISFYSGFISRYCKRYLRAGGILVANNSHGDASLAAIDSGFRFVGTVKRRGNTFRIDNKDLHLYFQKKDGSPIDEEKILSKMRGEGFSKTAYAYLFEKLII